jgi:thioesterase domain-containing protein
VKIRGFRIELGEIEAVLGEHPAVRQAVVLAREDAPGDKRLVAYVMPASPTGADIEPLRSFLRERLPEYMRPSAYVVLAQLPLTPTGKLDRRALPPPARGLEDATRSHEPPRDSVERTLCQLWAEVLGVTQVGIDADFFDLGGHSLLAAQLFARMDRAFGRSLPLAALFDAPTVRGLAHFYRDGSEHAVGTTVVPITLGGSLPPVFAVPGVGGNVLGFATLARELGPEQPFFGLQSVGLDGACEPLESIEHIAAHHLQGVRQTQPSGPYRLLGACFGAAVACEMTRQLLDAREEVAFLGLFDPSSQGGDLAGQSTLPTPAWLRRGIAFASFVASRLRLYVEEARPLGYRQRVRFVGSKLKLLAEIVHERDVFRGDYRQFHQRRVYASNLRALRRYKQAPLNGGPEAIEVFRTGRRFDRAPADSQVDWTDPAGKPITYHKVPGKNSGDMLQGENAKVLARLLSARLECAPRT